GSRQPANCNARHKTAIIIPYRDRKTHLKIIVNLLHDLLKTQNLAYNIFVVEQVTNLPDIFNKAAIMNAGFIEVMKLYDDFDCFIFHDVDMAPLEYSNFYVCLDIPRHVGAFLATFHFQLPYKGLFGGATAFRKDQFLKFNGFSNEYYGWGGEDDDILKRLGVKSVNMAVNRFPSSVARYKMFPHHADPRNPGNQNNPSHYPRDGLNTAKYTVESVKIMKKYTHILISL
ncbi:hypothetical protein HELRODRAFT_122556, partial [Helobdella robusta]|uniref:Galactosyltransferase N-terminal domain-containing protein n=1 Tax=Helobdella robusta TaxID=6412 RepID=T1EGV1_HELRO